MSKWYCVNNTKGRADIYEDGGSEKHIYVVALDLRKDVAEKIVREHNTHGELLEALEKMLHAASGEIDDVHGVCENVKAAIAKAKGEGDA